MYRRRTPEELLDSIAKLQRGRLKIMMGAVSGSGKTYQMLQEGKQLLEQGIDAVLCAVTLPRLPEAEEWLASFERVPSIHWRKDGVLKKDLDVEALLLRNPEVVLVDGLAHRNRPGARNESRLQDIRELLEQGIGVITTVNVYELQGAQEMAPRFPGVRPEASVPAETLELADEVRLVDVSPETILKRLEEGDASGGKAPELTAGTISVLRELALRLVAEGVGEELARHRERLGLSPSGAAERILVCAQYHGNGSLQVRRGEQIARRLGGDLTVLTFIQPGKPLTREQLIFKRSISKLAVKVGAAFEERPLKNKRFFPAAVIRYAAERGITRIVMGQSKEKAWRQVWAGNMAAGLLHRARGIDLFFMADRSERDGERIIPARRRLNDNKQAFRRASPEELAQKIGSMKRGRLKVYIGAAPGVGKTYAMLREGNELLRKGVDVVIGLLETHGRRETIGQIGGLAVIPRKELQYQETKLSEMDTAAIIARNPELVLVDELAHTNVPGSANGKRYEDVLRILDSGISVIATMNVQHLESLNDVVEQLTGVRVRETVPDAMLEIADEVELIDLTPQMLRQRMREGKIYAADKIEQALSAFFTTSNLIALREFALRELADDVDERLEAWDRGSSLRGRLRRQEVIVIGLSSPLYAERLIRRGFRIAHRLKADWQVVLAGSGTARETEEQRRTALEQLTERLGGQFVKLDGKGKGISKGWAERFIEAADKANATQLIVGREMCGKGLKGWLTAWSDYRSLRKLLRMARHMDLLIAAP